MAPSDGSDISDSSDISDISDTAPGSRPASSEPSETSETIGSLPLDGRHIAVAAVASMEQVTGAALSTVAGVIIPLLALLQPSGSLPGWLQGVIGAAGLTGIAVGSAVIGRLCDREGYLRWSRLCPLLIAAASVIGWLVPHTAVLVVCLFAIGVGVGGGYSLDESYVSELMPRRWRLVMVGAAKATCAVGFIGAAVVAYFILRVRPEAAVWPGMLLVTGALGLLTFLLRLRWWGVPRWLEAHGRDKAAREAAEGFFGPEAVPAPPAPGAATKSVGWGEMFRGPRLDKVIFSAVPWACEGLGVYGIGVFLPVLVMALGIESASVTGIQRVMESVETTALINAAIVPGFVIGLWLLRRMSHLRMLTGGFLVSAAGLGLLLASYVLHWPVWVSIAGFLIFEMFLNMGPHLVTFVIPARIFPASERGTGSGIAAMGGKTGAIAGVFVMPLLLEWGGGVLVLAVSIAVMCLGALVSAVYGPRALPPS